MDPIFHYISLRVIYKIIRSSPTWISQDASATKILSMSLWKVWWFSQYFFNSYKIYSWSYLSLYHFITMNMVVNCLNFFLYILFLNLYCIVLSLFKGNFIIFYFKFQSIISQKNKRKHWKNCKIKMIKI